MRRLLFSYVALALSTALLTWQVAAWKHGAGKTRALERQRLEIVQQMEKDGAVRARAAQEAEKVRIVYRTIREEVRDADLATECPAPPDFERLWNKASAGATGEAR